MNAEVKQGICPVCVGAKRVPYTSTMHDPTGFAGYDPVTKTLPCNNCTSGMESPTGLVNLRPDGTPCVHHMEETSTPYQSMHGQHFYRCTRGCGQNGYVDSSD